MAKAQTDDEKNFVFAFTKEAAKRREATATGWKDGVAGEPVSELVCLAYVRGWVSGREAYNKNVYGTDGADPMPKDVDPVPQLPSPRDPCEICGGIGCGWCKPASIPGKHEQCGPPVFSGTQWMCPFHSPPEPIYP